MSRRLRRIIQRLRLETLGVPLTLPPEILASYPELTEARWRLGGFPLRVGGWCLWQRSVAGITLGATIFLAQGGEMPLWLLLHELAHVRQFRRDKSFPMRYFWESLRHGYRGNRYEVEADQFVEEVVWSKTRPRQS